MDKPNLERMWETFIKFSIDEAQTAKHFDIVRNQIYPLITKLRNDGIINWYCFLVHDKSSGVPTTPDDTNFYYHIRFDVKEDITPVQYLPSYCVLTRKIDPSWVKNISIGQGLTYNTLLMKDESIEEVWRIIGEQSEWVMNLLNSFKENVTIPFLYVGQFLHYYANMTMLRVG